MPREVPGWSGQFWRVPATPFDKAVSARIEAIAGATLESLGYERVGSGGGRPVGRFGRDLYRAMDARALVRFRIKERGVGGVLQFILGANGGRKRVER